LTKVYLLLYYIFFMPDIWNELIKVDLFSCPNAEMPGYREDPHYEDPHYDPDIIKSYYFCCLKLKDGYEVTDVLLNVYKSSSELGKYEVDIYGDIEPSDWKFDAASRISSIETRIKHGLGSFLRSMGLI
jgi:hypothetical protein